MKRHIGLARFNSFKCYFQQFLNSSFMEYVINLKTRIMNIYEGFLMPTMTRLQYWFS